MRYYVDGLTYYGNPSDTGGGYTIFAEDKFLLNEEVLKKGFTSNEAELLGVLHCAKIASTGDEIYTDSKNTTYWCRSGKPKARPDLTDQAREARDLIRLKNLKLIWCPREVNLAGIYNDDLPIL